MASNCCATPTRNHCRARTQLTLGGYLSRLYVVEVKVTPLKGDPVVVAKGDKGEKKKGIPEDPGDRFEVALPAPMENVVAAAGGRYLILHLPRLHKLAVFDVAAAKVVKEITVSEDTIKYAASQDQLVVLLPGAGLLRRYSLRTFEPEATVPVPFEGKVRYLTMGSAGNGPLLATGTGNFPLNGGALLDLTTLKPLGRKAKEELDWDQVRAAPCGTVFSMWMNKGDRGRATLEVKGNTFAFHHQGHIAGWGCYLVPSADGRILYGRHRINEGSFNCSTGVMFAPNFKLLGGGEDKGPERWLLPTGQGPFYFDVQFHKDRRASLAFCLRGDEQPFATLGPLEFRYRDFEDDKLFFDKRIHVFPEARTVICIPSGNNRLLVQRHDLEQALKKSDLDILVVLSLPPTTVIQGGTYTYPMKTFSRKGGVKYRLESGPQGMRVDSAGLLTWDVPTNFDRAEAAVVVALTDQGGLETFHTFKIAVVVAP